MGILRDFPNSHRILNRARHRNRIPRITVAVLRFRLRADRPLTPVGRITDTGITATVWAVPYTAVYGSIRLYGLYRVCMDSGTVFGSKTTYEEALSDPGMSKELDRSKTHLERHFLAYYYAHHVTLTPTHSMSGIRTQSEEPEGSASPRKINFAARYVCPQAALPNRSLRASRTCLRRTGRRVTRFGGDTQEGISSRTYVVWPAT